MHRYLLGAESGFWPNSSRRVHLYFPHLPILIPIFPATLRSPLGWVSGAYLRLPGRTTFPCSWLTEGN